MPELRQSPVTDIPAGLEPFNPDEVQPGGGRMLRNDKVGPEKFPARGQVTLLPVDHDPFAPPGLEHFDPDQPEAAAPAAQAPPAKPFGLADTWPARLARAAWE